MAQPDPMMPVVMRSAAPKAKMTPYFALLIISLIAMLLACLFMYLEVRRFGGFGAVPGRVSAIARPARTLIVRHCLRPAGGCSAIPNHCSQLAAG
jgi:hypothetical protein